MAGEVALSRYALAVAAGDNANEPGQPINWQAYPSLPSHGYDNEIAVLSPVRPDGRMSTLHRPADMAYVGDVDLDWDADRLLFSSVNSRNRWQVFEIGADGKGLRQVTRDDPPDVDNFDACYLPDRRIVFTSTVPFQGVICTAGSDNTALLCSINADGSGMRRLCFDQEQNWHPSVTDDGRVLYTRWEYADFKHTVGRLLFAMNPDARWCARSHPAAATRSSRVVEKVVSSNAPPLTPIPVESKRSTATPRSASARASRTSDLRS